MCTEWQISVICHLHLQARKTVLLVTKCKSDPKQCKTAKMTLYEIDDAVLKNMSKCIKLQSFELQGEMDRNTLVVGDFNIPLNSWQINRDYINLCGC